jgi:hypothetical protein
LPLTAKSAYPETNTGPPIIDPVALLECGMRMIDWLLDSVRYNFLRYGLGADFKFFW